jgi:hypothetical protein
MGSPEASNAAFTDEECKVVKEWVEQGGCLLLIADHSPMGAAAEKLAEQFKVDMSKGYTFDAKHKDESGTSPTNLQFDAKNGLLADHPITRGRSEGERIKKVVTFTGQSLKGPKDAQVIFKLADSATDQVPPDKKRVSAAGRCQGLTLKLGKGRAVILGEAGFLSAQIVGPEKRPFGMNKPGIDNKQFALNMMHWLSGLIEDG